MITGPASRTRTVQKKYHRHLRTSTSNCEFCDFTPNSTFVKHEFEHFWIVTNAFGYAVWDGLGVSEHLMVLPKRHVESIKNFTPAESLEYMQIIADYEAAGYSLYSRAPGNKTKSVPHQHTHLIQLNNTRKKAHLHIHKPHIVLYI